MQINISDPAGGNKLGEHPLSEAVFGVAFNEPLVHQVVTAYMAKGRAGTHAQKTRAQVRGGGIKPWRQKGTGRARAGTIRSPLWRKGGVIFAAQPRDYSQKVNRKVYRHAMRSILSELFRQERITLLNEITLSTPKTKGFLEILKNLKLEQALVVIDKQEANLSLASRNVIKVQVVTLAELSPVDLIKYEHVVFTVPALAALEESLG
jgi:large subunit ribosomal protein L4